MATSSSRFENENDDLTITEQKCTINDLDIEKIASLSTATSINEKVKDANQCGDENNDSDNVLKCIHSSKALNNDISSTLKFQSTKKQFLNKEKIM